MKTIEERAMHIAREFSLSKANKESAIYRACIRMAKEQIDIACDVYQKRVMFLNQDAKNWELAFFRKELEGYEL